MVLDMGLAYTDESLARIQTQQPRSPEDEKFKLGQFGQRDAFTIAAAPHENRFRGVDGLADTMSRRDQAFRGFLHGPLDILVSRYYPAHFAGLRWLIRTPRREIYQVINTWQCGPACCGQLSPSQPVLIFLRATRAGGVVPRFCIVCPVPIRRMHPSFFFLARYLSRAQRFPASGRATERISLRWAHTS